MTGTSRKLGLVLAFCALAPMSFAQDIQETFQQGVDLLRRGRDEEALRAFEQVLAADPSHEAAYELFKQTEHDVWIEIMAKKGDFDLIARRLQGLAMLGRLERRDDADAIRALVAQLKPDDPISRLSATRQLAAEHGEYAVPYLLPALSDSGDEDRRVAIMQTLTQMGLDVVLPLIEALDSPEAFLRRNVALTLGRTGDARAVPMLAHVAANDSDPGARQAAGEALAKLGASGTGAAAAFVQAGNDYLDRRDNVLAPHMYSDVVWHWEGRALAKTSIPREVYPEAIARKCFARALTIDPASSAALAGFVRAQVGGEAKVAMLAEEGRDVSELSAHMEAGSIAAGYAGVEPTDKALQQALAARDVVASIGLIQALKAVATTPTAGLQAAMGSEEGTLRSRAAIALAHIAVDSHGAASAEVVGELGNTVGRQIQRIAFVIDGNAERAAAVVGGLQSQGVMASSAATGGMGLAMLGRLPGLDLVIVADRLPDLTAQQVLSELEEDTRYASVPRMMVSDDVERAGELYGDDVAGVIAGADVSGVPEVLSEGLNRDREEADLLSQHAAVALAELAAGGADLSSALDALAGTLASRPDAVAVPASHALERAGTGAQIPALVSVVADSTRSDEVRAAASSAIAMIVSRGAGSVTSEGVFTLRGVAEGDGPLAVRQAAARAVGVATTGAAERAGMIRAAITPAGDGEGGE